MSYDDHNFHREREQQCRALAEAASDPNVRRRHEELADLHAGQAAQASAIDGRFSSASAA